MKTDLASTLPILASHPPLEGTPGVLQAVPPTVPIIPIAAAKPAFADESRPRRCKISIFGAT